MFSHFAQSAGWWALLGIPLVIAIHYLQQKAKKRRTSTLFLMEALSPESAAGRTWEHLRASKAMWLQLLVVCLCAWILLQPRFVRENSSQTVAIVLDDSLSMTPFREQALAAAASRINEYDGRAARTRWIIMGTSDRKAALYRGTEASQAKEALQNWNPVRGTHDAERVLTQVAGTVGDTGVSWFITNAQERCPAGQASIGVGRNLSNVGFVGSLYLDSPGRKSWRAAVKNHSSEAQSRILTVSAGGEKKLEKTLEIPAGALVEEEIPSPGAGVECILSLTPDEFTADDILPLVEPQPRPMGVSVEVKGKASEFFRKLVDSMPGLKAVSPAQAGLRIVSAGAMENIRQEKEAAREEKKEGTTENRPEATFLVVSPGESGKKNLLVSPVVAERDSLTEGLSLGGLLSPGVVRSEAPASAQVLYWQGGKPLVWSESDKLVFNWPWDESNADRLPAVVLLIRRYWENVRQNQPGTAVVNVPLDALLNAPEAEEMRVKAVPFTKEVKAPVSSPCRAPDVPSYFRLMKGEQEVLSGSAFFDDVRQGNFSVCAPFVIDLQGAVREAREQMALPDPLVPLWIALMIGALLWSWWPERRKS